MLSAMGRHCPEPVAIGGTSGILYLGRSVPVVERQEDMSEDGGGG
jgi:hypothetical protein